MLFIKSMEGYRAKYFCILFKFYIGDGNIKITKFHWRQWSWLFLPDELQMDAKIKKMENIAYTTNDQPIPETLGEDGSILKNLAKL